MGREIKRVALGFDWELNKIWDGYLFPESIKGIKCLECNGSGQTDAAWWIQHYSYRIHMLFEDSMERQSRDRGLHPYFTEDPYPHGSWSKNSYGQSEFTIRRPSDDIQELINGIGEHMDEEPGHYTIMRALAKMSGVKDWGVCKPCKGIGELDAYPGQLAKQSSWEPTEPPAGEGWQLWETVSEGSPISPVFSDRDGLINWLTSDEYTWGASTPLTREEAERFVSNGYAVSMVLIDGQVISGDKL